MIRRSLLNVTALAASIAAASLAHAESVTDPAHSLGITGSHNQYKLSVDDESGKERLNKGGIFYNYGNKLTGAEGFIFQVGADAQYGERGETEVKSARIELDLGARAALSQNNYVDVVVGAGYDWDRLEYDGIRVLGDKVRVKLDSKTPLAKAALGYNYLTSDMTARLEVGGRYSIDGRTKLTVEGSSDTIDMKDKLNPYAELTFVFNKGIRDIPVVAGLYYEQTRYELRNGDGRAKLKQEEVGLKLGLQI